jgi:hypothetical protein
MALGARDFVVINSEHYRTSDEESKNMASRDVVGILCPSQSQPEGRRSAQIVIDGSAWSISQTRNDVYDLTNLGEASHRARWYIPKAQRRNSMNSTTGLQDRKFYFATILPHTKKHPTVASLSKTALDIYDNYNAYSTSNQEDNAEAGESYFEFTSPMSSQTTTPMAETPVFNQTDESLRRLILLSAAWITFCEGWSPHMNTEESKCTPLSSTITPKRPSALISQNAIISSTPSPSTLKSKTLLAGLRRTKVEESPATLHEEPEDIIDLSITDTKGEKGNNAQDEHTDYDATPSKTVSDELQRDVTASPFQDPTAQFRHLLSIDTPNSGNSHSPIAKFESIVRRRSTHGPSSKNADPLRNRTASWKRRLSLHHTSRVLDTDPKSDGTSIASSEYDGSGYNDSHDHPSETNTISLSTRSVTPSPSPGPPNDEGSVKRYNAVVVMQPDPPPIEKELNVKADSAVTSQESTSHCSSMDKSAKDNDVSRPSSQESESTIEMGIGGPYWREFDRIQTQAFKQRAQQVQPESTSAHNTEGQASMSEAQTPKEANEGHEKTRWLSGLRRSVSRRRRSMIN